ncbi:MAG: outer membrane protein assembly factor [Prevotellaceae bacterium]|nr:outer membrane protein assembly factor [Prevotellaceae bacterium]
MCFSFAACKSTKRVANGKYLLWDNYVVVTEKHTVSPDNISPYIYQKPNVKMIFGLRFYLSLYNLAGIDTTKWINRTLRNWGAPPVLYDSTLTKASIENIEQYMRTQGYYQVKVKDSVVYSKKKAKVYYVVDPNQPYRIQNVSYNIPDTAIHNLITADSLSSTLRWRRRLSTEMLDNERERIALMLRDKGYFGFNKGFITYEADTLTNSAAIDIKVSIANVTTVDSTGRKTVSDHKKYKIKDVYVYADFDPVEFYSDASYLQKFDTLYTKGIYLMHSKGPNLRAEVIPRASLIFPGMQYKESDVTQTYNNFSNLQNYRSVTIQFRETNEMDNDGDALIDCEIQLNPLKSQSAKADIEVSLSSSDLIGFSPGLHYGHRNLFRGAEQFSLDFRGVFQYTLPGNKNRQNSFEYNISSSISVPKFLAPIRVSYFKKQIPHTKFSASYTYQQRPYYTRSVASGSIGYLWNSSSKLSFIFNPIDFNMVKMLLLEKNFYEGLQNEYLKNTYKDHFVLGLIGSVIYTNQNIDFLTRRYRRQSMYYFRVNLDLAGNVLSLFNSLMKYDEAGDYHMVMKTRYSQYAKIDFNFIYNKPIETRSNLVYRIVFGIGKPYGNEITLPFEKQFYAGGTNSLRGWPVRGVGPGQVRSDTISIPYQTGDLRLEANIEYRFPLFWRFEGAGFIDAGNVWSISSKDPRPGAQITSKSYKDIAVNTGLGLRLNLSYFIFRLDMGFRLHDPARELGEKFIPPNKWLNKNNYALNIGINYPF